MSKIEGHDIATLWYPRSNERKHVTIELIDVRAADDLRIEYDFDRDGYVIKQQRWAGCTKPFESLDYEEWVEVAFIEAWQASFKCPNDKNEPGPCHNIYRTGETTGRCGECGWEGTPKEAA